jgi:two-component system, OmpR family, response regulator VanR
MSRKMNRGIDILVVEDSKTQAHKLCQLLEREGFTVTVVHDGKSALEALSSTPPSLVVSDVIMPDMDGFQLCSAIRSEPTVAHLPVVLLTTLSNPSDLLQALACGADHFITKPYDDEYLLAKMNSVVASLDQPVEHPSESTNIAFGGHQYLIRHDMQRIVNLLISSYDSTVMKNRELQKTQKKLAVKVEELQNALDEVKVLQGILPICMHCKKIRDDQSYWHQLERFITENSQAIFSHGICPECAESVYGMTAEPLEPENLNKTS